ncbi:hypothetical protein CRENBAI_005705 [Crenichthys baileyi]|uniref:Uncharacterized protein n=1 Tax=Crenichthys baileyi TaxID=28760 RepID=A0AAV9RGB1_9TELE
MLPTRLHSGVLRYTTPDRMFPPKLDLADSKQESASDPRVQQQMEEAMRHLQADLEVLPSPLLLEQMKCEAVQRRSLPAPLVARLDPAAKPASSSRCKKRWRGAPSCFSAGEEESPMAAAVRSGVVVSLPAFVRAAARNPASSSATALSPMLAAALPMPSSLAPAQCSEATPDELEELLRFFARQIKSFRRTSLLYSSPELRERIRQMEEDYETTSGAAAQSKPGLQGAATEQPTPSLQGAAVVQPTPGLQSAAAVQPMPGLQSAAAVQPTSGLRGAAAAWPTPGPQSTAAAARPTAGPQSATAAAPALATKGLDDASAPAHATEGLDNDSAPVHATEGPGDASAPAQATEGLSDASAPAHATEGLGDASAPAQAIEVPGDTSAPAHATEGLGDASAPALATEGLGDLLAPAPGLKAFQGFKERLVLILTSETGDEGFEDEPPSDPVPEWSEEKLVLILASDPRDEGFEEEALLDPVSEGFEEEAPPDPVSEGFKEQLFLVLASKGSPGSVPVSGGSPGTASVTEGFSRHREVQA